MANIITIQNVRGYEKNGTVYLNVEDTARGLGFVHNEIKNGVEYSTVRWATVNQYLQDFGFANKVAKDDYIPENIFYRLAMKAKNEVAEKFQAKVADEILPAIRRTGFYSARNEIRVQTPTADIIHDIGKVAENIQELFAVKRGIALSQAIDAVEVVTGYKFNNLKQLLPPAEHEIGYLNATQIGNRLGGLKAQIVNKLLESAGLQLKENKQWRLTDKGREYAEELPFTRNGHSDYKIGWSEDVIDLLQ